MTDERLDASPGRRTLVISGVGMTEGGILAVLRHLIESAERVLEPHWRIVALVHCKGLINASRAELIEYPALKASWLKRMHFEWRTSARLANELAADIWLAAHDITPLVDVERQYVYCHNPTCFARPTFRSLYFDWIFVAHSILYGFLYSLNIRRNAGVFVQQSWIREEFMRRFAAREVVVSRPAATADGPAAARLDGRPLRRWIYPTFPRHFKNVEVIGRALELLEREGGWTGEVVVTIAGDEGRYARYLARRFGSLRSLKFIGRQDADGMKALYAGAEGLLFPSKLETWGLPITEAQVHRLPLLVADLKYAHETVGDYDGVTFFDPTDPVALAHLLRAFASGDAHLGRAKGDLATDVPCLIGWDALVRDICR